MGYNLGKYRKNPYALHNLKNKFEKEGCLLLSNEYKGNQTQVKYLARCGHEMIGCFLKF